MKTQPPKWTLSLTAVVLATGLLLAADAPLHYAAQPRGSKVSIDGTSSIHDWTVVSLVVAGSFEVEPAFDTDKSLKSVGSLNGQGGCPKVEVTIPIRSLKSNHEKMDEVMQEAMKMTNAPSIKYRATEMKIKGTVPDSGSPVTFATKGTLSLAGVTNNIDMDVTMTRLEGGKVSFTGTKPLKMSDFKIEPPRIKLLGITTGDEVTIKFEWNLAPKRETAAQ